MKTSLKVSACMAALAVLMVVQSASTQVKKVVPGKVVAQAKLEGAWKVTEISMSGPNAQKIAATAPSLILFTKKHFSLMTIGAPTRPDLPQKDATDAQKVAAWGPFAANSGTYEVKGTTFTAVNILAKDPGAMAPGNFSTWDFKIVGNTLTVTPTASNAGPATSPLTVKLERVE